VGTPGTVGNRTRIRRLALCCSLLAAGVSWPLQLHAKDPAAPAITVGEPEGFANLTEARTVLVDI
jgi:hypothetical protein